jgi:hypothetical protein
MTVLVPPDPTCAKCGGKKDAHSHEPESTCSFAPKTHHEFTPAGGPA